MPYFDQVGSRPYHSAIESQQCFVNDEGNCPEFLIGILLGLAGGWLLRIFISEGNLESSYDKNITGYIEIPYDSSDSSDDDGDLVDEDIEPPCDDPVDGCEICACNDSTDATSEINCANLTMTNASTILILSQTVKKLTGCASASYEQAPIHAEPSNDVDIGSVTSLPPVDEIASIFEEEHQRQSRTVQQTLDVGRITGKEPVKYYSKRGGGYATVDEIHETKIQSEKFRNENQISRADEVEIMHTFNGIRGMNYYQAMGVVEEQGYSLHPIYINKGAKRISVTYSGTIIGVCVDDPDYNPIHRDVISKKATVSSIVDVGGQDKHDRGIVKI